MRIFTLLILWGLSIALSHAQNLRITSFKTLTTDLSASTKVVNDGNENACALIKVVTTDKDYHFETPLGVVKRDDKLNEIWLYVPRGTKKITVTHPKLGTLRNYELSNVLVMKTVYEMIMASDMVEVIIHEDVGGQYLVMNIQPAEATVYIDNLLEAPNAGSLSKMLKYGDHIYRIEHPLYETKAGTFKIEKQKMQLDVKLVPAYGHLSFVSVPAGAEVSINGEVLGHTPFRSKALREGAYRIKTSLLSYLDAECDATVVRGQTSTISVPLTATFGYLEVNTTPEQGADVYVNNTKVGKTPYRSDKLYEGSYKVKVMQAMYMPQEKEIQIVKGQTEKTSFNLAATFADVTIRSEQPQADIFVNNAKVGTGLWKGRLSEGFYLLATKAKSHRDGTVSMDIKAGKNQEIVIPAPSPIYGSLNISSSPVGAVIKIDGKEWGCTPDILKNILVGERSVEILQEGCAGVTQTVVIEEGRVKDLNVRLSQGKEVYIEMHTPASISIDGVDYGNKPFKVLLSYGKHQLTSTTGLKKTLQEEFTLSESSPNELYLRNGNFRSGHNGNQYILDGIGYSIVTNGVRIDDIVTHDYYTGLKGRLPLPGTRFLSLGLGGIGDVQGFLKIGENLYIDGKWQKMPDCKMLAINDMYYLVEYKRNDTTIEVTLKNILETGKDQVLFSKEHSSNVVAGDGEFKLEGDRLSFECSLFKKKSQGKIGNMVGKLSETISIKGLSLPPSRAKNIFMPANKVVKIEAPDPRVPEIKALIADPQTTFPAASRLKDNAAEVLIIKDNAYVIIEYTTTISDRKLPDRCKISHQISLYKYNLANKTWMSFQAPITVIKETEWGTLKQISKLPYYKVTTSGVNLLFDDKYSYNTEENCWYRTFTDSKVKL